jgi:aminopeptidase N
LLVSLAERPAWVAFDPDLRVIGEIAIEAPVEMLRKQLEQGTTARVRWAAAEALGKRDDPPSIEALGRTLAKKTEAWMVRAEAARALGKIKSLESGRLLEAYVKTEHPKVRRAVVAALGNFREPRAATALSRVAARDASYLVQAEAARALGRTREPRALEALLRVIDRASWADVVRAGALDGLAALREEKALGALMDRTRYGFPTRGRRAAISALPRVSDSKKVREHLEDMLDDADPHLRIDVVNALQTLGDGRARTALRRRLDRELDGRVVRRVREALRDLGDASAGERHRMNDDLESLKNELGELKARLSRIEEKQKKPDEKKSKKHGESAIDSAEAPSEQKADGSHGPLSEARFAARRGRHAKRKRKAP